MNPVTRAGILEITVAFAVTSCCLYYVYLNPAFDLGTLIIGVVLPFVFGSSLLLLGRQRVLFFVFSAYFWSLVDDAPVHFDSVLTWPEVTRYQPVVPYFMDYVLLVVVLSSFYLAVREILKGKRTTTKEKVLFSFLTLVVFGLSYIQDIELNPIRQIVASYWYQLDLVEHIASATVLLLVLKMALSKHYGSPDSAKRMVTRSDVALLQLIKPSNSLPTAPGARLTTKRSLSGNVI